MSHIDQFLTFANNMFERLGLGRMKRQVDQAKNRTDTKTDELIDPVFKKIRDYNLGHDDMTKINLRGLMKRGDTLGKVKVFTYLTKVGDPLEKLSVLERIKKRF